MCCVQCRLSGVSNGSLASLSTLSSCHQLLSLFFELFVFICTFVLLFEDHDDYDIRVLANDQIILYYRNENVNDQLINLLDEVT